MHGHGVGAAVHHGVIPGEEAGAAGAGIHQHITTTLSVWIHNLEHLVKSKRS